MWFFRRRYLHSFERHVKYPKETKITNNVEDPSKHFSSD
jgi:hypothetical protein